MAARKEVRAPKPKASSEGKGKGRGKGLGKGRGKGKASKAHGAKPKTPYALAKEEYMKKLLLAFKKELFQILNSKQVHFSKDAAM